MSEMRDKKTHKFPSQLPWILSIHHPHVSIFRNVSSANIQLIKILQQFPEFGKLLDELYQEWITKTLIHGDIKWDNCLVFASSGSRRMTRLKIVDWEFASMGDPCWAVGSVFSSYLSFWLLSIPITGEYPPQ